jgi:hypothetical protein
LGVGTGLSAAAAIPQKTIAAKAKPADCILEWHFILFSPGNRFPIRPIILAISGIQSLVV